MPAAMRWLVGTSVNPDAGKVNPDAKPQALKAVHHWVLWQSEKQPDSKTGKTKMTEIQYQVTGRNASSTNFTTWSSFENVITAYRRSEYFGVGLDHRRDAQMGAIEPWAQVTIDRFISHTEATPSRDGDELLVLFLFQTGLRISEALGLRLQEQGRFEGKPTLSMMGKGHNTEWSLAQKDWRTA